MIAVNVLGDLLENVSLNLQFHYTFAHSPSTTTFLVLMATLTPSGISSNSSEWL